MKQLEEKTYIKVLLAPLLIVSCMTIGLIGCGSDRPFVDSICDDRIEDCSGPGPFPPGPTSAYRWSNDLYIQNQGLYREFLKDARICDFNKDNPLAWSFHLGYRCKDWDDRGFVTLELGDANLPTQGRITFTAISNSRYGFPSKSIPIGGEFQEMNDGEGFGLWATSQTRFVLREILKMEIEEGRPEDNTLRIDIYYGSGKIGYVRAHRVNQ